MVSSWRIHILLLAGFAVLFNLLAMPLDRALRPASPVTESLILGSFCTLHGVQSLPKSLLAQLKAQLPDLGEQSSSKMQSGDCCCGHAGQAALPGEYFRHLFPRYWPETLLLGHSHLLPLPREQWPRLNPRASPAFLAVI